MAKQVSIAGLGWLGKPLALKLMTLGYIIKGSVTSESKAKSFKKEGIDAYSIELTDVKIQGDVRNFLYKSDYLIILIPPGLRRNSGANYVAKMTHFLREIENSEVKKIILVSSTSVYDDAQGVVTEKDIPLSTTNAGKQLFEVEQLYFNSPALDTTIVRFGGLFGGARQPARYLAGRKDLRNGKAPVNLIHRRDCLDILSEVIKQDAFPYIFNAVIPKHPSKEEYYTKKALALNLTPPEFSSEKSSNNKIVNSDNLELILNYQFSTTL